jgi:hypothetical protein
MTKLSLKLAKGSGWDLDRKYLSIYVHLDRIKDVCLGKLAEVVGSTPTRSIFYYAKTTVFN